MGPGGGQQLGYFFSGTSLQRWLTLMMVGGLSDTRGTHPAYLMGMETKGWGHLLQQVQAQQVFVPPEKLSVTFYCISGLVG